MAGTLAHVCDQQRRGHRAQSPGQQNDAVNASDIARSKHIGGERGHGSEAAAVGKTDKRDGYREQQRRVQAGQRQEDQH